MTCFTFARLINRMDVLYTFHFETWDKGKHSLAKNGLRHLFWLKYIGDTFFGGSCSLMAGSSVTEEEAKTLKISQKSKVQKYQTGKAKIPKIVSRFCGLCFFCIGSRVYIIHVGST